MWVWSRVAVLFAAWSAAVAEIGSADHTWPGNILDLARAAGCTKFAQLAEDNGLGDMLRDQGPFTLLAPSDDALSNLSDDVIGGVFHDVKSLLTFHMGNGNVFSSNVANDLLLSPLNVNLGKLRINIYSHKADDETLFTVNGVRVLFGDGAATNGVLHVIDGVMAPVRDNLLEIIKANPELTILATAIQATQLEDEFRSAGPFTVMAPTNAAFEKLPGDVQVGLLLNPDNLKALVMQHVIRGSIYKAGIFTNKIETSINGTSIKFTVKEDKTVYLNGNSKVLGSDYSATNGVSHVVDTVLIPPSLNLVELATSLNTTTLVQLLKRAALDDTIATKGPFTLLAPTNQAFADIGDDVIGGLLNDTGRLKSALTFHVVAGKISTSDVENDDLLHPISGEKKIRVNIYKTPAGEVCSVNGHIVTTANQLATNGVVHVISGVVLPATGDLLHLIRTTPELSILYEALQLIGLEGLFTDEVPLTGFAPNNAAFDKLPEGSLDWLEKNPNVFKGILLNHCAPRTLYSAGIFDGIGVPTYSGRTLRISTGKNGSLVINGKSNIIKQDMSVSNGVAHIIDTVLLPMDIYVKSKKMV